MRKKSHIALAAYLQAELRVDELDQNWKAFYFGSIEPDLNPKMLSEPHEFNTSWKKVRDLIRRIALEAEQEDISPRTVWTHVGIVMHYLADFFTFPHNAGYGGNLKGHCLYENRMKYLMRAYLRTAEARAAFEKQRVCAESIQTTEQLFAFIEQAHQAYVLETEHSALDDCRRITEICSCAGAVMARMVCPEKMPAAWMRGCVA